MTATSAIENNLEAFAQLYSETADLISAHGSGDAVPGLVPTVTDGVDGVRFITRAVESSSNGACWVAFK